VTRLGWLGPAQLYRLRWAQPEKKRKKENFLQKLFQKICDFPQIFLLYFDQYWFVYLYCKDTNLVLKYLIFVKTLKICFVFMHTAKSLKQKKITSYFHSKNFFLKKHMFLHALLTLITSLLKL
jgi:hypothetical protein